MLAIVLSHLATQLTLLVDACPIQGDWNVFGILGLFVGLSAVVVILTMPLQDPDLSKDELSLSFEHPSSQFRSPEDNLTLWHFMTVSWMTPLVSLGSARQLNDEDVWSLGFEFRHRILHDNFSELKGSVVRRLLAANGIDLVIISFLAALESLASKWPYTITRRL